MLATLSGNWDPIGSVAKVLMMGKLLFQSIVRLKTVWDEPVKHEELIKKWLAWLDEIEKCKDVVVSRSIMPSEQYETNI